MANTLVPRILLGSAIGLSLVSGVLSFQAKGKMQGIRDDVAAAKAQASSTATQQEKAKLEAKGAKEQLAATTTAKEAAEAQATAAKADAEKAQADLKAAKDQNDAKEAELAKLKADMASKVVAEATPDPEIAKKLKDAEAALAEKKQVESALESKAKDLEARTKVLEEEKQRHENSLSKPGIEGKVLAVNGGWNFVVLSIGDRQGVAMNSTLLIKRGSTMIAKVRITSVEPVTSIADIVPGTRAKGLTVQPGDVVIYSGS